MFGEEDLRTPQDIEYELCHVYELSLYDRQSLREVELLLSNNSYKSIDQVHDHIYYVEHLLRHLEFIRNSEAAEGFPTFDLDHSINEIKLLFRRLKSKLIELEDDHHTY